MKLPDFSKLNPLKKNQPPSNYFLTLTIGKEKVDAVIFQETLRRAKVIGHSTEFFEKEIDTIEDEKLLNSLDRAISQAETNLPSNIETQTTIFGVDHSWVETGKIKKEYLLKLKKISEELELKPVGFIVTTEAISHLLQKEEGAPISAILTEIGKKYLSATLLRGGRIIESKTVEISDNVAETLDSILKHFSTPEVLPSRIIVFGENDEKINQEFTSFQWSKSLPFLHLPQINPLPSYFDAKSVFYGAVSQMNFIVSDASFISSENSNISDIQENPPSINHDEMFEKTKSEESGFGFVEGEDVSKNIEEEKVVSKSGEIDNPTLSQKIEEIPNELQVKRSETKGLPLNALLIFSAIKPTLSKLSRVFRVSSKFPLSITGRSKFLILPILILGLVLIFSLYYLLFRSATVSLVVSPKSVQQTQDVTFGEDLSTDASQGTIKAKYIPVSEDGKLSTQATGKKQTGDKAKGKVTIFNLNQSPKTYSAGTTITSSNNLSFTLDNSVIVATGSSDPTNPSAGTASVNVTASSFGTQYNLPSGTKFSVGSDPLVAAKNDDPFSGGTSKDITVVSNDDLNKLTSDMTKTLQDKAKQDISGKITSDEILLPQYVSTSFDNKSFSKKVGDEASSVSLTATVSFKYITYSKDDLQNFAQKLFAQNSSQDLVVNKDETKADAQDIKIDKKDHTEASLTITTSLLPKIDQENIARSIEGKPVEQAKDILSKIPQIENISISLSPNPIFLPRLLPSSFSKNLSLSVFASLSTKEAILTI